MLDTMSHWNEGFLGIVVGGVVIVAFFMTVLLSIIAIQIRKSYLAQREWSFKHELLSQGLTVEEIERLLDAGQPRGRMGEEIFGSLRDRFVAGDAPSAPDAGSRARERLYRSTRDVQIAGVLGGLAGYFQVDPTLLRVLFVLAVLMTGVFPLLVAYAVMAVVMPREPVGQGM